MATAEEKFRKLIAAYEDEVQRKQHKMGKRIEPTDIAQPNPVTGVCTFLRGGQQVVWSPSFDVLGTWEIEAGRWTWGWADQSLESRVRSRVEEVRRQGGAWGIDTLTMGIVPADSEQAAWEFAVVATGIIRAEAMYRVVENGRQRFLGLFEGAAPTKSTMMRAVRPEAPGSGPMSAVRVSSGAYSAITTPAAGLAATAISPLRTSSSTSMRSPTFHAEGDREPTNASRAEIGSRLLESVPYVMQQQISSVTAIVRAAPPAGPVGSVALDVMVSLRPMNGPPVALNVTPGLQVALQSLWHRCRERNGAPYRSLRAHLEGGATTIDLEL